jgi:hypothetical protein
MLARRIRSRCKNFMRRLFLRRPTVTNNTDHLHDAAARHGVTGVTIIKARTDSKLIARGLHPEWGTVAVKAIDPIMSSIHANSARYTDGLVTEHPTPFLPKVYASGVGYSVTEWIDGPAILRLGPVHQEDLPATTFVDSLGSWCTMLGDGAPLETSSILSIVRFYIETTVRRMEYRSAWRCAAACARFQRHESRLGGYIDDMASLAPELGLHETPMFSDVHAGNLVYCGESDRIVLVDFEALRPGHYLFDVVFCMASLMIAGIPRSVTEGLADHLFSPAHVPPGAPAEFFRSFASYIVATYMTIDGRPGTLIDRNLDVIQSAGV